MQGSQYLRPESFCSDTSTVVWQNAARLNEANHACISAHNDIELLLIVDRRQDGC